MNEKYTGKSIFQKYYTTDSFPYKQKENKGELEQYLVQNTMPVIISEEKFEIVQKLIAKQKENSKFSEKTYPLSGKIKCGKCGCSFKRKMINKKVCWTCSRHNLNASNCEIKPISQEVIYSVLVELYNKLWNNYKHILVPLQTALQELKIRRFNGNSNVMDIHKEIAKLKEQIHVLATLKTKGFIDNAKYFEQTTELTAKINKLQSELKKITRSDDEDETLEQIEILIDYFEKQSKPISEFNEAAFEFLIEKIVVISQNELEFHIIGGLKFNEKI